MRRIELITKLVLDVPDGLPLDKFRKDVEEDAAEEFTGEVGESEDFEYDGQTFKITLAAVKVSVEDPETGERV